MSRCATSSKPCTPNIAWLIVRLSRSTSAVGTPDAVRLLTAISCCSRTCFELLLILEAET